MKTVEKLVCGLVVWMHVRAGVSRAVANTVLVAIRMIMTVTFSLLETAIAAHGVDVRFPAITIPRDVRTAYTRHFFEPKCIRYKCCPKCFKLYLGSMPDICTWRSSPRSEICGAKLWKERRTRNGTKKVPICQFSTNDPEPWFKFFLGRQIICDALRKTHQKLTEEPWIPGSEMSDPQDSPAFRNLFLDQPSPYNLIFGIYVDWFAAYKRKIAGKKASCGLICLYCLNLPKHLRYRPENVFIVGITPGPSAPNCLTLHHLFNPIIKNFRKLGSQNGVIFPTYYDPEGIIVRIRISPVLADSPARALVSGFVGHKGTEQAIQWKTTPAKNGRQALEKEFGVRWSPLHDLPYWDPVNHVVLGFMHNWLEGILENHLRVLWGVGRGKAHEDRLNEMTGDDEAWSESDGAESGSELEDLRLEAVEFERQSVASSNDWDAVSTRTPPPDSPTSSVHSLSTLSSQGTPTAGSPHPQFEHEPADEDYLDVRDAFNLPIDHLEAIRECIRDVTLPTWVSRPPGNLGEPKHGKLKANDYLVLFAFILPLIVPEFWRGENALEVALSRNFADLVICTNIICSFKTSNAAAELYTSHYIRYRGDIQRLFPHWKSLPNHHYGMHNGPILKRWGPLPALSEFPGERTIGELQEIPTNTKIRKSSL
ncbi:hypothetical protein SCHPADRAFT_839425 [Schizopora paradoxa]|uniref:Uncharacterized protein n=1 Tax=Schizopora paradoxa TaxID=27342 RepID=A0A0H2RKV5_9AGAM|nr:hypothetical protein SCHPADRAFT_839425 [Schizopora paradoxa]